MPAFWTFDEKFRDVIIRYNALTSAQKEKFVFFQCNPLDVHKAKLPQLLLEQVLHPGMRVYAYKAYEARGGNDKLVEALNDASLINRFLEDMDKALKEVEAGAPYKHFFMTSPFEIKTLAQIKQWDRIEGYATDLWNASKNRTIAYGTNSAYYLIRAWSFYNKFNSYYLEWNWYYNINNYFYNEANSGTGYLLQRTYSNFPIYTPFDPDAILGSI